MNKQYYEAPQMELLSVEVTSSFAQYRNSSLSAHMA